MKNPCLKHGCILCCLETEMLLTDDDIERIEHLGHHRDDFMIDDDGWLVMKNSDGKCVFHDGKICRIYDSRPDGCRLYPVIFDDDDKCAFLDPDCPHTDEFKISETNGSAVVSLVDKLENERSRRRGM